jgi:hypothetical protein
MLDPTHGPPDPIHVTNVKGVNLPPDIRSWRQLQVPFTRSGHNVRIVPSGPPGTQFHIAPHSRKLGGIPSLLHNVARAPSTGLSLFEYEFGRTYLPSEITTSRIY